MSLPKDKQSLLEKRNEIIFALASQRYDDVDIGFIFNRDKATIGRVLKKMPKDYQPKWVKQTT